ncbi:hypothetical protein RMATCC62417_00277 [Rhizopus microsporus]|nr:hypothetical protein RMATCC62417_00277 [Rhizopus microsporus]
MAHDVIDLMDHFGWTKNIHLDGVSMGGMIALELVSRWPERFGSLVLTSTTAGRQIPTWRALTTLPRLIFIKDPAERISQSLALVYPPQWLAAKPTQIEYEQYQTNQDLSLALQLARMDRSRPQTLWGNMAQMAACMTHHVSEARLQKIRETGIPILVMTGTWDHLVNPRNSYYLADKLGAELKVFEGAGHGLPGERQAEYNQQIDEHFTRAIKLRR